MGQYYRNTILKRDFRNEEQPVAMTLCPYDYDNGAKLMEFSWIGNGLMRRIEWLLANQFAGFNFVTVGDYSDEIEINGKNTNVYYKADDFEDSKEGKEIEASIPDYGAIPYYKYAVNLDKKEYVILKENSSKWVIHPLSLLCAFGNGRGGGDFHGDGINSVGKWAFDRILVTNDKEETKGMKEIKPRFKERY